MKTLAKILCLGFLLSGCNESDAQIKAEKSPRIWLRVYSQHWNDHLKNNFTNSKWTPNSPDGCVITGFLIHESYPNVNYERLKTALDSCRALGFVAKPGMVWHMGANQPDPYKKWEEWTKRMQWFVRCGKVDAMGTLQDPKFPGISLDLELYDSAGQEHALWSQYEECYTAAEPVETLLSKYQLIVTQYLPSSPQNMAFGKRVKHLTWINEAYWGLPWKEGDSLAKDMLEMQVTQRMLRDEGRGYMPQTVQSIARDYAAPQRAAMVNAQIDDVFSWTTATDDDVNQMGTLAWKTRPKEPPAPPPPSDLGKVSFDIDPALLPPGSLTVITPVPGTIAPVFKATVAAECVPAQGTRRAYVKFDNIQGQGFTAGFSRQLSADYTIVFAGLPPSWKYSNDGTGWVLGPSRFYAAQAPSARWNWGGSFAPADLERHVIVCEQSASGKRSILIDGVQVATSQDAPPPTDGVMTIGNVDAMNARPVKMELERMTVSEGVDREKSISLSRKYCEWYGIPWRGSP